MLNHIAQTPRSDRRVSGRTLLLAAAFAAGFAAPLTAQTAPAPSPAPSTMPSPPVSQAPVMAPAPVTDKFYTGTWAPTHWRASDAVGQSVYNVANERIGEIEELLIDGEGRVLAAVVGVGGFLGLGERDIAVSYRSFQMTRDKDGKARLVVDIDKPALQNAPVYKPADMSVRG